MKRIQRVRTTHIACKRLIGEYKIVQHPNFEVTNEYFIQEYETQFVHYRHKRTGCELLSVQNKDENKVFSCAVNTVPWDDTGVFHIIEHSVLCGSKKFPVKEPFMEALKCSLNTFLNAFTMPNMTLYPVSSTNQQDFYNLINIYCDSIFNPLMVDDVGVLKQEGWHKKLEKRQGAPGKLSYNGIVYNEMKGVYSDIHYTHYRTAIQKLLPDSHLKFDSGGQPEAIRSLTFDQFRDAYRRHYHPSNMKIWISGNDPVQQRLDLIDSYIGGYGKSEYLTPPTIAAPPPGDVRVVHEFQKGVFQKNVLSLNWAYDGGDAVTGYFEDHILNYLLSGNESSVLYHTLKKAGLSSEVHISNSTRADRVRIFSISFLDIDEANMETAEKLVRETIAKIVEDGFDKEEIASGLQTLEFELKENDSGRYPTGLVMMMRVLPFWMKHNSFVGVLAFQRELQRLTLDNTSGELGKALSKKFSSMTGPSNRFVVCVSRPRDTVAAENVAKENEELALQAARMTDEEWREVEEQNRILAERNARHDREEDLLKIPKITLAEVEVDVKRVPMTIKEMNTPVQNVNFAAHNFVSSGVPCNDVLYCQFLLNISNLPKEYWRLLSLYKYGLTLGTPSMPFSEVGKKIHTYFGELDFSSSIMRFPHQAFQVKAKMLPDKIHGALRVLKDILLNSTFNDPVLLGMHEREIIFNIKDRAINNGDKVMEQLLRGQYCPNAALQEYRGGVTSLGGHKEILDSFEHEGQAMVDKLLGVSEFITKANASVHTHLIHDSKRRAEDFEGHLNGFTNSFTHSQPLFDLTELAKERQGLIHAKTDKFLCTESDVNFVTLVLDLNKSSLLRLSKGALRVAIQILNLFHLHENVRVKGGAYGAYVRYNRLSNTISFASYRDPHIMQTIEVFLSSGKFLESVTLPKSKVEEIIISTIRDYFPYMLPHELSSYYIGQLYDGLTVEELQQLRAEVLKTTPAEVKEIGKLLTDLLASHSNFSVGVVSNTSNLGVAADGKYDIIKLE